MSEGGGTALGDLDLARTAGFSGEGDLPEEDEEEEDRQRVRRGVSGKGSSCEKHLNCELNSVKRNRGLHYHILQTKFLIIFGNPFKFRKIN